MLSLSFLAMTRSKSSMGLLPVALLLGGLYRMSVQTTLDRAIAAVAVALVLLVLAAVATSNWNAIAHMLEDPQQFTGRAAIWQAELAYIGDHPLLGAGFGTFANTGVHSPVYFYVGSSWVSKIGEGHSGYLELLVTIGSVGFSLALAALIVRPFFQFWRGKGVWLKNGSFLFALFGFVVLHNFMESDFLGGTSVQWGQFLLILGFLHIAALERRSTGLPNILRE